MIGMTWFQTCTMESKPVFRLYDEHTFYERLPIKYGYKTGDTVQSMTTGKQHVISKINWGMDLWVSTEDMPTAKLSFDLYTPLDYDRTFEYHPLDRGIFKGLFEI
jgi:hypothetical protein